MKVTYIGHSGFLAEFLTAAACLIIMKGKSLTLTKTNLFSSLSPTAIRIILIRKSSISPARKDPLYSFL